MGFFCAHTGKRNMRVRVRIRVRVRVSVSVSVRFMFKRLCYDWVYFGTGGGG